MRLGDLDSAKDFLKEHWQWLDGDEYADGFYDAMELLKEVPTIDAVPVVRCRDCVHWLDENGLEDHVCLKIYDDAGVHSVAWQTRKPDDFCSYGKRKDGDS